MGTRALRFTEPNGLALLDTDIVEQINIVKVGVNYRLGVRPVAIRY
jgi:hypothetical protein